MSILLSPLTIKSVTLRNRIGMSPMCQYSAKDGYANDWHLVHQGTRAAGGAGLIISEATAISPEGRITPGDLGIWDDNHIQGLRRITDFVKSMGAVPGIQIAHAGRKASCHIPWEEGGRQIGIDQGGWETFAPGNIPFRQGERDPKVLDDKGITRVISDFKSAAARALRAGYKILEIHSAHGYLLFEFLSPLSNHRKDAFGGSFENRIRLLCEVVKAVITEWPEEYPLFVRISATEWVDGQWTPEESVKLAVVLKNLGVDLIDCSSGGNVPYAKVPDNPGYQVPFSEAIRKTGIMTAAVGLITDIDQAEAILQQNKADLILLGREILRNPYFPILAAEKLGDTIKWPDQYLRAKK